MFLWRFLMENEFREKSSDFLKFYAGKNYGKLYV